MMDSAPVDKKVFFSEFLTKFLNYSNVLTLIPSVAASFEQVKNLLKRNSATLQSVTSDLLKSLTSIKEVSKESIFLDYNEYLKIAETCKQMALYFIKNSSSFKKNGVRFEGLVLTMHSLTILRASRLNDSSFVIIKFWQHAVELFSAVTVEIDYFIGAGLSTDQFEQIKDFYPTWSSHRSVIVKTFGADSFNPEHFCCINRIIDEFSENTASDKSNLALDFLHFYKFDDFCVRFEGLLRAKFGIQMNLICEFYLDDSLTEFVSSENAQLKTFRKGLPLHFLRHISNNPIRNVSQTLFDMASQILGRKLF